MVATYGDASAIWIRFFGADYADHFGVSDFFAAVEGNVIIVDEVEGVSAVDAFGGTTCCEANALTEAAQFIGVGFAPHLSEHGVLAELAVFKGFACSVV
jgi:hypothetical protein